MMPANFAAFLTVAVLVIVTPGQDTALAIRNTLAGGRASGLATAAGVAAGQAMWTLLTSVGLAALLVAFEPGFIALRVVGAVYLVLLGAQALRAAFRRRGDDDVVGLDGSTPRLMPRHAFRRGLISNLSNPKMVAFERQATNGRGAGCRVDRPRRAPGAGTPLAGLVSALVAELVRALVRILG